MEEVIKKGRVKGTVMVPASKSLLQRYMIAAALSADETELTAVSHCNDTLSCLAAIQELGARVTGEKEKMLKIVGSGKKIHPASATIHCGESGFAFRALSAVAALSASEIQMTGSGSLLKRPVEFMTGVFRQLGVKCSSAQKFLPLTLQGPVTFRNMTIDGSESSQLLSGLLMIYPFAEDDHILEVQNLKSRYYIDLTLEVMRSFGIAITHEHYAVFRIPGGQQYKGCKVSVEGDWSAASCMLVAGAIAGEVTIENLTLSSNQPDKKILDVLRETGADVITSENIITVKKPDQKVLTSFSFDATHCPDLFPALAALATQCRGTSEIKGVERLIHKESNRAVALQEEFSKLRNNSIRIEGNKMIIEGGKLQGAKVHAHNDHRIAMALAVAALNAEGETLLSGSESVNKSYPEFFNDLSALITL